MVGVGEPVGCHIQGQSGVLCKIQELYLPREEAMMMVALNCRRMP